MAKVQMDSIQRLGCRKKGGVHYCMDKGGGKKRLRGRGFWGGTLHGRERVRADARVGQGWRDVFKVGWLRLGLEACVFGARRVARRAHIGRSVRSALQYAHASPAAAGGITRCKSAWEAHRVRNGVFNSAAGMHECKSAWEAQFALGGARTWEGLCDGSMQGAVHLPPGSASPLRSCAYSWAKTLNQIRIQRPHGPRLQIKVGFRVTKSAPNMDMHV
eukprot:361252-Chlamydomonas_euryale.AAC.2